MVDEGNHRSTPPINSNGGPLPQPCRCQYHPYPMEVTVGLFPQCNNHSFGCCRPFVISLRFHEWNPYGHHRREEEPAYPPPPYPYGHYEQPPPPYVGGGLPHHYPPPPPPRPPHVELYPPPPPHAPAPYTPSYYRPPPPPQPTNHQVSHESSHHSPHMPPIINHHHSDHKKEPEKYTDNKRTVRVYSKEKTDYSLTIRDGKVILAPSNPSDPHQHWIKDEKFSIRVKDEQGFPSFALVNKATGQAMKHSIGVTHPVQLTKYNSAKLDESVLWTWGKDLGYCYRAVRMVNNIRLNVAFNGVKDHGGVIDGTQKLFCGNGMKAITRGGLWSLTVSVSTQTLLDNILQ